MSKTPLKNLKSWELRAIVDEMKRTDVLEDRREYMAEDLAKMYDLDLEDAAKLYVLVQKEFR